MLANSKRIVPIVVKEDFSWDDVRPEIAKLNFIFFHHKGDDEAACPSSPTVGNRPRNAITKLI